MERSFSPFREGESKALFCYQNKGGTKPYFLHGLAAMHVDVIKADR
jgi:hypothetical protein